MGLFSGIKSDAKTPEERAFHDRIQKEAGVLVKKVIMHAVTKEDVDKLEATYKEYFNKWPNPEREASSNERLRKLRNIV